MELEWSDFKILPALMVVLAAEIDEDFSKEKSSKDKSHKPPAEGKMRLTQSWLSLAAGDVDHQDRVGRLPAPGK